jgi:hypothetical protein
LVLRGCTNDDGDPDKKRALAVADEILSTDFAMYFNNESDAEAKRGKDKHKEKMFLHKRSRPRSTSDNGRWAK